MKLFNILILQFSLLISHTYANTPHLLCENHIKKQERVKVFCDENMITSSLPSSLADLEGTNLKSYCESLKGALGEGEDLSDLDLDMDFGISDEMELDFDMTSESIMEEVKKSPERHSLNDKNFLGKISERPDAALCQCKTALGKENLCANDDKEIVKKQMQDLVKPLKKARSFRALGDIFDLKTNQALYQMNGKLCGGELESTMKTLSCAKEVYADFKSVCGTGTKNKLSNKLLGDKEKEHCDESKSLSDFLKFPGLAADEGLNAKLNFSESQVNFLSHSLEKLGLDNVQASHFKDVSSRDFRSQLVKAGQDSDSVSKKFVSNIKSGMTLEEILKTILPGLKGADYKKMAKNFFIFDYKSGASESEVESNKKTKELNWLKIHLITNPIFSDYFYKGTDLDSYNKKYLRNKAHDFNRLLDRIKNDQSKLGLKAIQKEEQKIKMADQCRGVINNLKKLCSYDEMAAFKELQGASNENQIITGLSLIRDNEIIDQKQEMDPFFSAYRSLYCSIKNVNFQKIDPLNIYEAEDENSCNTIFCPIEKKDVRKKGTVVEKKVREGRDAMEEMDDIESDLASGTDSELKRNHLKKRLQKLKLPDGSKISFNGNSLADIRSAMDNAKKSWKSWSGKKIENHKKEINALIAQTEKMKKSPSKYGKKAKKAFKEILDDHFAYSDELQDAGLYDFDSDLESSLTRLGNEMHDLYPETKKQNAPIRANTSSTRQAPISNMSTNASVAANTIQDQGAAKSSSSKAESASASMSAPSKKAIKKPSSPVISSPTDTARTYKVNTKKQLFDFLNDEAKPTFKAFFDKESVEMVLHKLNADDEYEEVGKFTKQEFYKKREVFHETIREDGEKFFKEFGSKTKKLKNVLKGL